MFSRNESGTANESLSALRCLNRRLALGMIGISLVSGGVVSYGDEKGKKQSAAPDLAFSMDNSQKLASFARIRTQANLQPVHRATGNISL